MTQETEETTELSPIAWNNRPAGYSSPSIRARRHRILKETRKMIAEDGVANLSMDEVSRRAGVAKRTLYNAFQSKERLVAAAIHQYFDDYASQISYSTEEATIERAIEHLAVVAKRNLAIRNYTRALMNIYHSHGVDRDIWKTIHDIAALAHEPLIRKLYAKRQLQTWVDPDELINGITRYRYAVAQAWGEGLMDDKEFLIGLMRGFLALLAGATRGKARAQLDEALHDLLTLPAMQLVTDGPDEVADPVEQKSRRRTRL